MLAPHNCRMPSNFKRYRDFVIVLLALAVPFWFLRASMRDSAHVSEADRIIVQIASPVQYAAATLARGVSNVWGDYVYLVDVKADNRRLSSDSARLTERVHKLEGLEAENRRLRRLLDLKGSLQGDLTSAQVIGKNTNEFFRVVRVSLDRNDRNIGANLPVLSPDGVVGTTLKASGSTVDVRLVVDAGSGVDVIVQRTGARGFVSGTGEQGRYAVNVQYVQRTDEVEVGDLLVTSGVGRRFPKDIPVGRVIEVDRRSFGIYQKVVAAPAVDFSRLEEVLIVGSEVADADKPATTRAGR